MKNKGLLIGIIVIVVIALGCGAYFLFFNKKEETKPIKEEPKEVINNYVAYVKINPSIKLEYTEKCLDKQCEEPIVTKYELLNDDAKEMFKNVNLLDGDDTLAAVIENICKTAKNNNIEVNDVEIVSDWEEINAYIEKEAIIYDIQYNVEKVETNEIENIIETKVEEEKNIKEQEITTTEPENEIPKRPTKTETTKDNNSISLSDNVKYNLGGEGYCCNNCFTDDLINEFKNAKGYYVTKADNSTISFERINGLSGSYNSAKYYGDDIKEKLIAAGGENCSGFGGAEETLTNDICNKYHLNCTN